MLEGGPQHWGWVARAAVHRANLVLALIAKLPERAKNAASFGHSNAENLSAPLARASASNPTYRLVLYARHVSLAYGALAGVSPPENNFSIRPCDNCVLSRRWFESQAA